jgi:hypothetical protein
MLLVSILLNIIRGRVIETLSVMCKITAKTTQLTPLIQLNLLVIVANQSGPHSLSYLSLYYLDRATITS